MLSTRSTRARYYAAAKANSETRSSRHADSDRAERGALAGVRPEIGIGRRIGRAHRERQRLKTSAAARSAIEDYVSGSERPKRLAPVPPPRARSAGREL